MERSGLARPLLPKPAQPQAAAAWLVPVSLAVYLASGITQPLLMSAVHNAGLGDTACQLYMLPYYLGQAATGLLACREGQSFRRSGLGRCALISVFGTLAQNLNYAGNMLAGSAVFAVVYSSVTVWNALLSRLLLQRVLSTAQWAAVLTVFGGLALTGLEAKHEGPQVFAGACMVLAGSFGHAVTHVVSEMVSVRGGKVPPQINCSVQGLTALALVGAWELAYTLPHGDKVLEPAREVGTTLGQAFLLLLGLAVGNFLHAAAFFQLLATVGAVSTGVVKALQAVFVFFLSHLLYCRQDHSQCLTGPKTAALVVVVAGALAYALLTAGAARRRSKPAEKGP